MFTALISLAIFNFYPDIHLMEQSPRKLVFEFDAQAPAQWAELIAVPIDGDIVSWEIQPLDSTLTHPDGVDNSPPIALSNRFVWRGLDVRILRISPFHRTGDGKVYAYTKGRVVLRFRGTRFSRRSAESIDFLPLYRHLLLNADVVLSSITRWQRGGYLIIAHDSLADEMSPFIRWKRMLGYDVRLVRLSEISPNPTADEIKAYVRTIYETWDSPLTYLLLVGDNTMLFGQMPTFAYQDATDDAFYGMLEGDDYLPEVMVGRMAVDTRNELQTAIAKAVVYESDPMRGGSGWLNRALMIAGVYVHGSDTVNTTKLTKLRIMHDLQALGMEVDTVFWNINHGGTFTDIVSSINNGVSVVNYRGWSNSTGWVYPQFYRDHIQMLNNGVKLPVMFSISCGTGNFASTTDPSFGEAWIRAGTPTNPKGGPAFLGPSDPFTHTKWNNAIDAGIFDALYHSGIVNFRMASTAGLMNLIRSFPDYTAPGMEVEFYFHVYTVLGDPSLAVWRSEPQQIQANLSFEPHVGSNGVSVTINTDTATVSVVVGDSLLASAVTFDGSAFPTFEIPSSCQGEWAYLTVSAPDHIPFTDSAQVSSASGFVVESAEWTEIQGNGNGRINPDERFELSLTLRNSGSSAFSSPTVTVQTVDEEYVTVENGQVSYSGTVAPGASFTVSGFRFSFSDTLPDAYPLRFLLTVSDGANSAEGGFEAEAYAPILLMLYPEFHDANGNGYIEPGESVTLDFYLKNIGHEGAEDINVCLGEHPLIEPVSACVSHSSLGIGDSVSLSVSFRVVDGAVPGRTATLSAEITSSGFHGSRHVWMAVGPADSTAVVGPDCYGYWLYEPGVDAHIPSGAAVPVNGWIELTSNPNAVEVNFDANGLAVIDLPVTLRFYGEQVSRMTISRYGWMAPGETDLYYYRNWPIPSPTMPDYIIAPFWDHLVGGQVLYLHDHTNSLFVVEWHNVSPYSHPDVHESFEAIFYLDTHNVPTGDNPIMFIYNEVHDVDSSENFSTIGIGSRILNCGLTYRFAGRNASGLLGELHNGKQLVFAPVPPDTFNYGIGESDSEARPANLLLTNEGNRLLVRGISGRMSYSILRVDGRVVSRGRISQSSGEIDISRLPAGVYILKVGKEAFRFVRMK